MASVFLARDEELRRSVALKCMRLELVGDSESRQRFMREAHLAAGLDHPAILPVYTVDEWEGLPYLTMRHASGGNLRRLLRRGAGPAELLEIMATVAEGLAMAHRAGVLHRDLKPENVLFDESGRALVADWGLARAIEEDRGLTRTGCLVGTPGYMAPEQIRGEPLGPACDCYPLGVMLYEAVTGHRPFRGANAMEVVSAQLEGTAIPVGDLVPSLHPPLASLIMDLLSRESADRPDDLLRVADRLRAHALGKAEPAPRPKRSDPKVTVAALGPGPSAGGGATAPSPLLPLDTGAGEALPRRRLPALVGALCLVMALAIALWPKGRGAVAERGLGGDSLLRLREQRLLAPDRLRLRLSGWRGGTLRVQLDGDGTVPMPTPLDLQIEEARRVSRDVFELDLILAPPLAEEGRLRITHLPSGRAIEGKTPLQARPYWLPGLQAIRRLDARRLSELTRSLESLRMAQRGLDVSTVRTPGGKELHHRLELLLEGAGLPIESLKALGAVLPLMMGADLRVDHPFALQLKPCLAIEAQLSSEEPYRPPWGRVAAAMGIRFRPGKRGEPFPELEIVARKDCIARAGSLPRWTWMATEDYVRSLASFLPSQDVAYQLLLKMLRSKGLDPDAEILPHDPDDFVSSLSWDFDIPADRRPAPGECIFVEVICRLFSRQQHFCLKLDGGPEIELYNGSDMDPGYGGNSPIRELHMLAPLSAACLGKGGHRLRLQLRSLGVRAAIHPLSIKALRLRRLRR